MEETTDPEYTRSQTANDKSATTAAAGLQNVLMRKTVPPFPKVLAMVLLMILSGIKLGVKKMKKCWTI